MKPLSRKEKIKKKAKTRIAGAQTRKLNVLTNEVQLLQERLSKLEKK